MIDGDVPGALRNLGDRSALALTQLPTHPVRQVVAELGSEGIKPLDQLVAGSGPVTGHHKPPPEGRRHRSGRPGDRPPC